MLKVGDRVLHMGAQTGCGLGVVAIPPWNEYVVGVLCGVVFEEGDMARDCLVDKLLQLPYPKVV